MKFFSQVLLLFLLALFMGCSKGGSGGGELVSSNSTSMNCSFNGKSVLNDSSVKAYRSVVPGSCDKEIRVCSNGSLSGSFELSKCPLTCTFNDKILAIGESVTAYAVEVGDKVWGCDKEVRTCADNGILYGSFTFESCTDPYQSGGTDPTNAGVEDGEFSLLTVAKDSACSYVDGKLNCWGFTDLFSEAFEMSPSNEPTIYVNSNASQASFAHDSGCLVTNGALKCWGDNDFGVLGDGTEVPVLKAKTIIGSNVKKVEQSRYHTCALVSDQVWCWGRNKEYQLGVVKDIMSTVPLKVISAGATDISVGPTESCAVVSGDLLCWGTSYNGLLNFTNYKKAQLKSPTPLLQGGVKKVYLDKEGFNACAIQNGGLVCWGLRKNFRVGDASLATLASSGVTAVSVSGGQICAVISKNLKCWANFSYDHKLPSIVYELDPQVQSGQVSDVSINTFTICYIENNVVKCKGDNTYALLGRGVGFSLDKNAQPIFDPR